MSGDTPARKRGQAAQLGLAVVESGNQQRDDLHPDAGSVQPRDRVEDWLQPSAELAVVPVVEALEIDFVEVDVRPQVLEHARRAVAVRDESGDETVLARASRKTLDRPFDGDERLVVGRDDDPRALTARVLRPAPPASRRAAGRSRRGRAAPATSPSSDSSCSADRSRASRSCRPARRDRRGRTASSRPGRTARRRRSPTARAECPPSLNRTLHTPTAPSGMGHWWPQAWQRTASCRCRRRAARPAPAPPRARAATSSSCSRQRIDRSVRHQADWTLRCTSLWSVPGSSARGLRIICRAAAPGSPSIDAYGPAHSTRQLRRSRRGSCAAAMEPDEIYSELARRSLDPVASAGRAVERPIALARVRRSSGWRQRTDPYYSGDAGDARAAASHAMEVLDAPHLRSALPAVRRQTASRGAVRAGVRCADGAACRAGAGRGISVQSRRTESSPRHESPRRRRRVRCRRCSSLTVRRLTRRCRSCLRAAPGCRSVSADAATVAFVRRVRS